MWSFNANDPYCFSVRGTSGYVAVEIADVYGIRNRNAFDLQAKARVEQTVKTIAVPEDDWAVTGAGAGDGPVVLLELRA